MMAITVGLITVAGMCALNLPLGAAVLLGGILAPTDPVLASGVQSEPGANPDPVRFSLAGEGALNDGSAFPFVLLGLGLMGMHDLGERAWHWWAFDLAWATAGGLVIGAITGTLIGRLVVYLRTRHHSAVGLDAFLSLGLIAIAYGVAQLCAASGFLAVFAAGLALQRVREHPLPDTVPLDSENGLRTHDHEDIATHSHHASAAMMHAVQGFNEQLERLAELGIVLVVGAMLSYITVSRYLLWFVPLLFLILRPMAVLMGLAGTLVPGHQRMMISWFGIRGIGSVFYLMFALHHGLSGPMAQKMIMLTLVTIAASIIAHGMSVLPLMNWYAKRKSRRHDALGASTTDRR
jgi:NhaP-type Na+/H+ or K+/H+ antiporter